MMYLGLQKRAQVHVRSRRGAEGRLGRLGRLGTCLRNVSTWKLHGLRRTRLLRETGVPGILDFQRDEA